MTQPDDRSNLDDASAHYGLDHRSQLRGQPERRRKSAAEVTIERAARTGTPLDPQGRPIVALPDTSLDADPQLVGKSPDEIAQILAERSSHRDGCDDPKCGKCGNVTAAMLRGNHVTTGGGGSGGGRRRKKGGAKFSGGGSDEPSGAEENDARPCPISGRVSIEAKDGIYADGNPSPGEMMEVIGRALHRGVGWESISAAIENL